LSWGVADGVDIPAHQNQCSVFSQPHARMA
jgi:hypothetical protein